jgi:hypothetical protein
MEEDTPHSNGPPDLPEFRGVSPNPGLPTYADVLPYGPPVAVAGDPEAGKESCHPPGENGLGFRNTGGLLACAQSLRLFGRRLEEAEVVGYAVRGGFCDTAEDLHLSGGTPLYQLARLLGTLGVPARVEAGQSLEDLAQHLESGAGVIIGVNAGELWNSASHLGGGEANYALLVTSVARELTYGKIVGFFVNDTLAGKAGKFIDAATMQRAWSGAGGWQVVTDLVRE